ncbi:uncharacterized protein LOC111460584 [Cucurbita moschata]|uniref:Uncharacterized protein LOC111460584 n=1 Tax=Cucurbita moschata TaxID=3662 RepID=A0A6J1H8C0_CUCMO|nr:uncharacterized protein LOC111460584 [Cucurbita moschata]
MRFGFLPSIFTTSIHISTCFSPPCDSTLSSLRFGFLPSIFTTSIHISTCFSPPCDSTLSSLRKARVADLIPISRKFIGLMISYFLAFRASVPMLKHCINGLSTSTNYTSFVKRGT